MMQIPHRDHRSKSVWVVSGSIVAMVSAFERHRYEELSVGAGLYPGRASSPVGDPRRRIAGSVRAVMCSPAYRSEEHTSELQSLMRISYAVFCLKKKKKS